MENYAREHASRLLNRFAFELRGASRSPVSDAIHDLRVSVRRLGRCLKIFAGFFPARQSKKIRRRLRKILNVAAAVRNRDIALELLAQAGLARDSPLVARMTGDRKVAKKNLEESLKRWTRREFSSRWRARLGL